MKQMKKWQKELKALKNKYPVGSIIEIKTNKNNRLPSFSDMHKLPEKYTMYVTGFHITEQKKKNIKYAEKALGPRIEVSNKPDFATEKINGLDFAKAESVKPERIIRRIE